jgi:hypothetical protein
MSPCGVCGGFLSCLARALVVLDHGVWGRGQGCAASCGMRRVVETAPNRCFVSCLDHHPASFFRLPHTHSQPPSSFSPSQTGKRKLCWCVLPEDLGHNGK